MTVQSGAAATKLWARHAAIPLPGDLRDDDELRQINGQVGEVASTLMSHGSLTAAEQDWLRSVRPDLHHKLITLPSGAERGYVESLVIVIDALLASARLA
jgi:hypothetical protein